MKAIHLYKNFFVALLASCAFTACNKESAVEGTENCTLTVNLSMEEADGASRAVQTYNVEAYPGYYYLYKANGDYVTSGALKSNRFTLNDFPAGEEATLVLLASPKGNPVVFPGTESYSSYTSEKLTYQQGEGYNDTDITRDVYRDVIKIKPSIGVNEVNGVLTRQNGALEIRIKGMNIKEASLVLNGTRQMYFHDGTGGQVFSEGPVTLTKSLSGLEGKSDIRIRINLLPQEDITTDATANDPDIDTSVNKLTITDINDQSTEYKIVSDQGAIPVYPNQVTWLTLNGDGNNGNFEVTFSNNINLEEDKWDGWE